MGGEGTRLGSKRRRGRETVILNSRMYVLQGKGYVIVFPCLIYNLTSYHGYLFLMHTLRRCDSVSTAEAIECRFLATTVVMAQRIVSRVAILSEEWY